MTQGGWYEGRHFWDGQLGPPGVVMDPGASGFNKPVSKEVVQQTDPRNWAYLEEQKAQYQGPQPSAQPTAQPSQPSGQPSAPGGAGTEIFKPEPPLDITKFYESAFAESGVSDLEGKYFEQERAFIEAKGEINDNPFLSEATRAGREATLTKLFDERTANIRGEIATKKADLETKLNLQLKQLDINSQASQQAFNQGVSLLQMGALDNASGESIAQLTMATGIPSDMWYSAIAESKRSKEKPVQTSLIQSTADSGEVTVSVINTETGEIIKQSSLGMVGNAQGGGGVSASDQKTADLQQTQQNLAGDVQRGSVLRDVISHYSQAGGLTVEEIYRIYNSYSPYGSAEEDLEDVKKGKFVS